MVTGESLAFGELLRRYRVGAGLTQEELAERAHLSARAISDLERGARRAPYKDTVRLLAEALKLDAQERIRLEAAARRRGKPGVAMPLATPAAQERLLPSSDRQSPFVGRAREVALIDRHLAGAGPPALLLAGEPGIGKSRLLRQAVERAAGAGWRVLEGGCQRRGGQEPYAPLVEALERCIHGQSPTQLRAALQGCSWLVRLLPELADSPIEPLPAWALPPDQERRLLLKAVHRFLANVAGPSGTLLVLDDLQWAGADALDLLTALMRSPAGAPLRVLGAYRGPEVQPGDPLAGTQADLAQAELATHLTLDPLTHEEAQVLLASLLAEATTPVRERILQRTGGVPFFVVSCARGLQVAGQEAASAESLPWDLEQSIRGRVLELPVGARELLGVAAVVGRIVPRAVLLAAADQPEQAVLAGLDAACHAQLLEETGCDAYRFVHDVIREVVEADLGGARRVVLHRRIAEALQVLPGELSIEALAYHWARSRDREKAATYLEQAGDRAQAQGAHVAAEGYYRDLVDALDGLARVQDARRAGEARRGAEYAGPLWRGAGGAGAGGCDMQRAGRSGG